MQFSIVALTSLLALVSALPGKRAANPTVTISNGVLIGTATGLSNQPSNTGKANVFLGIPFAASPTRFAPPASASSWTSPKTVQTFQPACIQENGLGEVGVKENEYFNAPPPFQAPKEAEDCLYLNVYAPQSASPSNLKTVMVWIYGGDLTSGASSVGYYNGSSLAINQDVIVVTFNYRTNVFGFSNSPQIPFGQQNSGFLDQRFALQWVQQNIKSFGGDATKVTIFGESAGGYSVKQLLANPPSPLPFRAAIMESQQTLILGNGSANYQNVSQHFGCSNQASPINCLRAVPALTLRDYVRNGSLGFPPVLYDGTYTASNNLGRIQNGTFANVPILIGTNLDEARVFLDLAGINNNSDIVSSVLQLTGIDIGPVNNWTSTLYPPSIAPNGYELISRIVTDLAFTCTSSLLSGAIALAGRQPVWRYQYDGVFPEFAFFPDPGAYHSVEIPEVFGSYPIANQFGKPTPDQIALSTYMQGAWASFAKNPTNGPGWPKLGSNNGNELGVLGGTNNTAGESTQNLLVADYSCFVYDPVLIAANDGY